MIKRCNNNKCGKVANDMSELELFFHKDPTKMYGRSNTCKDCKNLLTADYRLQHQDKLKTYQKKYRAAHKLDKKT